MPEPQDRARLLALMQAAPPAAPSAIVPAGQQLTPEQRAQMLALAQAHQPVTSAQERRAGVGEGIGQAWNEQTPAVPGTTAQDTAMGLGEGIAAARGVPAYNPTLPAPRPPPQAYNPVLPPPKPPLWDAAPPTAPAPPPAHVAPAGVAPMAPPSPEFATPVQQAPVVFEATAPQPTRRTGRK